MLRHFCKNYTHSHNLQPIEIERTLILFLFLLAKFFRVFMSICKKGLHVMMVVRVSGRTVYYYYYYYYYASWKTTLRSPGGTSSFIIIHAYTHIFPLNNIHLFYIISPPLHIPYITDPLDFITLCKHFWVGYIDIVNIGY